MFQNNYGSQLNVSCSVKSCTHNTDNTCSLNSIEIKPMLNNSTGMADESLCSNYHCKDKI